MAGDNERFSARSRRWVNVAIFIGSPDNTRDESVTFILDNIHDTFIGSRRELIKKGRLEEAIQAFVKSDAGKLHMMIHNTNGNQLVQIMVEAQKMPEAPSVALHRIFCVYVEKLFSDMLAQARATPELYMRCKERLDMARGRISALAEELATRLLNDSRGKWTRRHIPKSELSVSLLR